MTRDMNIYQGDIKIVWCKNNLWWQLPGGAVTRELGEATRIAKELDGMVQSCKK